MATSTRKQDATVGRAPRVFRNVEEAARYAETHDVGEEGAPADASALPESTGGTLRLRLDAELLRRLRAEAIRRGANDLTEVATALLDERLVGKTAG